MALDLKFIGLILCCLHYGSCQYKEFELIPKDEEVFIPCIYYPNNFITRAYDFSNLTYETLEDNSISINGTITFLLDLPPGQKMAVQGSFLYYIRGNYYAKYVFRYSDICELNLEPNHYWFPFTAREAAGVECMPPKGTTYPVDVKIKTIVKIPRNSDDIPPNSKLNTKTTYGPGADDFYCTEILFEPNWIRNVKRGE